MSGLSRHLAMALFDMTLNPSTSSYVPPLSIWLSLHTSAPDDAAYGTEATYTGYVRMTVDSMAAVDSVRAGGEVDVLAYNTYPIEFPACGGAVGQTLTHWAIWDTETVGAGNILYNGAFDSPRFLDVGNAIYIDTGYLVITMV